MMAKNTQDFNTQNTVRFIEEYKIHKSYSVKFRYSEYHSEWMSILVILSKEAVVGFGKTRNMSLDALINMLDLMHQNVKNFAINKTWGPE